MKTIKLTQGKEALVSDEDYEYLSQWKWRCNLKGYAVRTVGPWEDRTQLFLHRVVAERMGLEIDRKQVDHINQDKLDDQRVNIRTATQMENMQNRAKFCNGTSGYKGVTWYSPTQTWRAVIQYNSKSISLGYFDVKEQAAAAYDKAAKELFGEFACLNGIDVPFVDPRGKLRRNNTSGFQGVSWRKPNWQVQIRVNGKRIHVGYFADKIEAALAYNEAALMYRGPDAYLNNPL